MFSRLDQSMSNELTIDCPHCQLRFSIPQPKVEALNTPRVSMAVATHEKPVLCVCGNYCVVAIEKYKFAWVAVPITLDQAQQLEGSKIITPPAGLGLVG